MSASRSGSRGRSTDGPREVSLREWKSVLTEEAYSQGTTSRKQMTADVCAHTHKELAETVFLEMSNRVICVDVYCMDAQCISLFTLAKLTFYTQLPFSALG